MSTHAFVHFDDRTDTCKYCLKVANWQRGVFHLLSELERFKIRMLKVPPFRYANFLSSLYHSSNLENQEIITKISPVCSPFRD